MFQLMAPSTYKNSPTTIVIVTPFHDIPHHSPATYLAGLTEVNYTVVGVIQTCTIDGDPAAYLQYTLPSRAGFQGIRGGFKVLWIHSGLVFYLDLEGSGGVDSRAIQDAKGVLASISYTTSSSS
jgi:hypothetical protein